MIADGNGNEPKPFKAEWAVIKAGCLGDDPLGELKNSSITAASTGPGRSCLVGLYRL